MSKIIQEKEETEEEDETEKEIIEDKEENKEQKEEKEEKEEIEEEEYNNEELDDNKSVLPSSETEQINNEEEEEEEDKEKIVSDEAKYVSPVAIKNKKVKKILYNIKPEPEPESTADTSRFPGSYIFFNTIPRVSGLSRSSLSSMTKPLHSNLFRK